MKTLVIILICLSSLYTVAQERTNLKEYGIDITLNTVELQVYKVDTTLKAPIAQKVVLVEMEGLKKLTILWLKPGKTAQSELSKVIAAIKKNKLKIVLQEKNALIMEQKGAFQLFYATVLGNRHFFIQSNLCSNLEEAKNLLLIAKSIAQN
jgi:hypothetical protein